MESPIAEEKTVHLCLDMQRLFAPGSVWETPWMARVTPNVVRLSERFGARNVFTRFIPPLHSEDAPGMWQAFYRKWKNVTRSTLPPDILGVIPELERFAPPGELFDKSVYSAFHDGRLHLFLQSKQVHTLVLSGAETDVCVLSTALDAVDHGYRVILAEDALCSSSDTGHDALMTMYRTRLAVQIALMSTAEAIAALR
jgi:nicotinamidase-related amidase